MSEQDKQINQIKESLAEVLATLKRIEARQITVREEIKENLPEVGGFGKMES